jgi:aryl-alcohol dehydrogenase-like predicted oxidoreductase
MGGVAMNWCLYKAFLLGAAPIPAAKTVESLEDFLRLRAISTPLRDRDRNENRRFCAFFLSFC